MKLEVGKFYVNRAGGKVRVDAIRPADVDPSLRVVVSKLSSSGKVEGYHTLSINGRYYEDERTQSSIFDLVAEFKEPTLTITAADVGRKVRTSSGATRLMTTFDPQEMDYPVQCGRVCYRIDGEPFYTYEHAIVELL